MFSRIIRSVLGIALVLSLTACTMEFENAGGIVSGVVKEYSETVEFSDKYQTGQPMDLKLDMKMAKAVIESNADKLAEAEFRFNSEDLKPEFKVKEDSISIKNVLDKYSFGKPLNEWNVSITDRLPLEIELSTDASDLKLNMSGMIISKMDAQLNASSAKIYIDEPNKAVIDKVRINTDASSVNLYGAGNIGFEVLDMDANASKVLLDLTGENRNDGEVRIDANASTVKLKLPEDVGVRIVVDKYEISSVKIDSDNLLSRSEREYVSKDYENAERTLKIYADLNVTTLTIE